MRLLSSIHRDSIAMLLCSKPHFGQIRLMQLVRRQESVLNGLYEPYHKVSQLGWVQLSHGKRVRLLSCLGAQLLEPF